MQLTQQTPGEVLHVRKLTEAGIHVGETVLEASFVLTRDRLIEDWPVRTPTDLDPAIADELLALEPEVILIGTGDRLVFPAGEFQYQALRQGVGVEVMDNAAACRTFNVLVAEDRRVVMVIML